MAIIKVKRDYCGQEGTDIDKNVAAGSEHTVTRARAAELKAVGLVDIISDEAHPEDVVDDEGETEAETAEHAGKAAPIVSNKVAPRTSRKAGVTAEGSQGV